MTIKNRTIVSAIALSAFITAGSASAQTVLTNGVSLMTGAPPVSSFNSVDVGSTPGAGFATQMPLSLSYAGVGLDISFIGAAGVVQSNLNWNPTPGSNFFMVNGEGSSATFQFSSAQRYFGFAWSSPDNLNNVQFFNGGSLLASINGASFRSAANLQNAMGTAHAGFNFSELAFDRVVMTSGPQGGFEFGGVTFSSTTPEVAPVPLGSVGGLIAFLAMMGARRRGLPWSEAMREANPFSKAPAARAA